MTAEVLVALFGGTGIATTLGILYQIWRERRGNVQKDMAGDLTLGELFRDTARKQVALNEADMAELRRTVHELRVELDDCDRRLLALTNDDDGPVV